MLDNPGPPSATATPPIKAQDRWLAGALRIGPLAIFLWMVRPLLIPVLLGALFALILYPLRRRLTPKLGRAAPALVTAGALILGVIPLVLIGVKAVASINQFLAKDWSGVLGRLQDWLSSRPAAYLDRFHISADSVRENLEALATSGGRAIAGWFGGLATAVPSFVVGVFLFTIALFYFLRDGRHLAGLFLKLTPFARHDTEELFSSIVSTVNGAVLGVLATAAVQGALTMGSLYVFSVPGAFLLGIAATFLAIIPMVGTTPITLGAAIYLLVSARFGAGVGMLVMAVVIGFSDNIVRMWMQSSQTTMHPLIALLSVFGGLEAFGGAGIFIGPVIAAIAVWVVDTYADIRLKQLQRGAGELGAGSVEGGELAPGGAAARP